MIMGKNQKTFSFSTKRYEYIIEWFEAHKEELFKQGIDSPAALVQQAVLMYLHTFDRELEKKKHASGSYTVLTR